MAVEGRQSDGLADAAARRCGGQRGTGDDGRGAIAVVLAVVLAGPDRIEAEPVDLGRELEALAIGPVPGVAQPAMHLETEGDADLQGHQRTSNRCFSAAQRSMMGSSLSAFSAGRVNTTRSTPISSQKRNCSRFSGTRKIVIGSVAGSRPASLAMTRNFSITTPTPSFSRRSARGIQPSP